MLTASAGYSGKSVERRPISLPGNSVMRHAAAFAQHLAEKKKSQLVLSFFHWRTRQVSVCNLKGGFELAEF